MVAIEFFVGPAYGRWARGSERFGSEADAKASIQAQVIRELKAQITPACRRIVPA